MKKTHLSRRLICLFLAIVLVVSVFAGLTLAIFAENPAYTRYTETGNEIYNSGKRNDVCKSLSTRAINYYQTNNKPYSTLKNLSGASSTTSSLTAAQNNNLYDALYSLMSSTHQWNKANTSTALYTYDDLRTLYKFSDTTEGTSDGTYMLFWAGYTRDWDTNGKKVNREHVWCKSHATYVEGDGGCDLHHLRPASGYVNQQPHNNKPYGNASQYGGSVCYDVDTTLGNYSTENTESFAGWYLNSNTQFKDGLYEPRDDVKGDTARILLYVYVRWHQPNLYTTLSSSECSNFVATMSSTESTTARQLNGTDDGIATITDLETLLNWCESDPVDTWEMGRNDAIQVIQGNRNVFIDYPELAWYMFGMTPPSDMTTPSGEAAGGVTPSNYTITATSNNEANGTVSLNGNVITATPTDGYAAVGFMVDPSGAASVSQSGNNFTVSNITSDCTVTIAFTQKTAVSMSYYANGSSYNPGSEYATVYSGEEFTLPTLAPTVSGWDFAGWTTNGSYENGATAPEIVTAYTPTAATNFYAVYRQNTGGSSNDYALYSGALTEGDYIIYYSGSAMKNTVSSSRLSYETVTPSNNTITTTDTSIIWHIAPSGDYWTLYNAAVQKYAAGTGAANKAQMLASGTDDKSLWSVSGTSTYEFVNKYNDAQSVNKTLRNNVTTTNNYGFACYSDKTGGALSLYKKAASYTYSILPAGASHEHDLSLTAAVAATCDTAGNTAYYTCSGCGRYFSDAEGNNEIAADSWVIPASGHNWDAGVVTTEADCGHAGVMTYTCQNDATHTKTENIPATGEHSYVATVTAPTASTEGYTTYTCSVCGNSYTGSYKYLLTFRTPAGVPSISSQIVDAEDADITLPTADEPTGYTFEGWVTQDYENVSDKPETVLSGSYTVQNSAALIALYSKSESGGTSTTPASLTQLSTTDTINDGDKIVIRAYNTDYALYQETSGTSYVKNWSFENNAATVAADDKNWVTFTKNGDTWYIGDDTNNYLYAKSGSGSAANTLVIGTTKTDWTLETNENGFRLKGNGRYLSCRTDLTTGNANLWRLGGTSTSEGSNNGTKTLLLYRYTPASTGSSTVTTYTTVFGIELHGVNLTLNGNINTNAYLVIPTAEREGLKAIVTTTNKDGGTVYLDKDGKVTTVQTGYAVTEALSGGLFKFVAEMPAKDMNTKVHIELKDSNNQTVSFRNSSGETVDHYDYCVQDYLQQVITHPDVYSEANYPGLLALCKAMSDYGYAAQMQFVYNTDQHPSTESGADSNGWYNKASIDAVGIDAVAGYSGYGMSNTDESLKYYGASLILESETTIRLYFTYSGTGTLTATVDGVEGKSLTHYADGSKYWFVDIKNIAAKDLDVKHSVTVSDGTNTAGVTNYAAYSYVWKVLNNAANRSENMVRLVQALYFYGSKAETYFK